MKKTFNDITGSDPQKVVIIYARYSTDMQNPQSCEDQVRVVRQQLTKLGIAHHDALVIQDEKISGTRADRPGYMEVLRHIKERRVSVLAVDELSRLTRGHDALQVVQDINYQQGRFLSFGENIDSSTKGWEMMTTFKQVSNNATIEETARRVRRGKSGNVLLGFSAGDFPFGYESIFVKENAIEFFERGQKPKKIIRINETEASTVREAFERFAKGESLNKIASDFSRRKLPRGNRVSNTNWSHQQIGRMVKNAKYTGLWAYGIATTLRNSEGKKRQVPTDPSEHIVVDRPELRIIDDESFERAQLRVGSNKQTFGDRFGQMKRGPKVHHTSVYPSSMLGRLVQCTCGAEMHHVGHENRRYFVCPIAKRRDGRCDMHSHVPSELATQRVLEVVINELSSQPEFYKEILDEMMAHLQQSYAKTPNDLERIDASIVESNRARSKLIQLIERDDSNQVDVVMDRIKEHTAQIKVMERERVDVESRQSAIDRFPSFEWFQAQLIDIQSLFESESPESMLLLRKLISKIIAEPVLAVGKKRGFIRLHFEFNRFAAFVNVLEQSEGGLSLANLVGSETFEGPALTSFAIDLGKQTKVDEWGPKIVQMRDSGMIWADISNLSGISIGNLSNYYQRYKTALASVPTDAAVVLIDPNALDELQDDLDYRRPDKPR